MSSIVYSIVRREQAQTVAWSTSYANVPGTENCGSSPERVPVEGLRGVTVSCNSGKEKRTGHRPYPFLYRGQFFSLSGFLYSRVDTQAPSYINTSDTRYGRLY